MDMSKKQKDAILKVIADFPEYPPFRLTYEGIRGLYWRGLLQRDRKALHQLQQQSFLSAALRGD